MKELIEELKSRYDIIMIDTAPIGLVSDAIPLIRMSDINMVLDKTHALTNIDAIVIEFGRYNFGIIELCDP